MSRHVFAYAEQDVSALPRALGRKPGARGGAPGHVEILNMLARPAGYRNVRHFRAPKVAEDRLATLERAPEPEPAADLAGRLARWPSSAGQWRLAAWALWSRLPAGVVLTKWAVNGLLNLKHGFADPLLVRRFLADLGRLWRTRDGRAYGGIEQKPPAEALALIRPLGRLPRR